MAAKLLHSLAEDNPDLQKQIGCMTGIFQIFDRHQVLTGRHKTLLPPSASAPAPGTSCHLTNSRPNPDSVYHPHTPADLSANRNVNEKHTESSRPSFSSCSSSLSSVDWNRKAQPEGPSFDRIIFPDTPSRDPTMNQSSHFGRQSLDLRDVVKDSMYREARGLSTKAAFKEEALGRAMKHGDSPRPLQLPTSADRFGGKGKQNVPSDLKESIRVLTKLREAPWHETSLRDAPRFSYDGRDLNRLSFECLNSTSKLKELPPRLSLDSREVSMRNSSSESNSVHLQKSLQLHKDSDSLNEKAPNSLGAQKRPPSVVAKLMGLDALPDSISVSDSHLDMNNEDRDGFSRSLEKINLNRRIRMPNSPRSSVKDPTSPRWKTMHTAMKPISSSRVAIEPAPWKHSEGSQGVHKPASRPVKASEKAPNSFPSVYSEIEKRLKDLEFKHSGKDLRALKQILEAMQAKGLLETTGQEGQASDYESQRDYEPKLAMKNQNQNQRRNSQSDNVNAATARGANSSRVFESPIVIMKPAKHVVESGTPAYSMENHFGIHSDEFTEATRGSINNRRTKDHSPKSMRRESPTISTDKRTSGKNARTPSMRPQPRHKENNTSSVKSSGSVSPRLQQKKVEWEKRSRPPTPHTSDSSKTKRQPNKQQTESGSPGRKLRLKSLNSPQNDDQSSEVSYESRALSYPADDDMSLQSESNLVLDSKIDVEVTISERSSEVNGCQSSSTKAAKYAASSLKQNKSGHRLSEDKPIPELASASTEHPSPVSVLDASIYGDDAPSPEKQIPDPHKGSNDNSGGDKWDHLPEDMVCNRTGSGLTSEINRKKLQNIEHLVQKLRRLNSNHDESNTDYIASLCENTNPDHRYISEILLASGLLLRDLGSGLATFPLHPSGHPINPELFFVLEQTKGSTLLPKEECGTQIGNHSKPDEGKFHRKLIFDAVNEILAGKLALAGTSPEPWLKSTTVVKKTLSAQKLLKELCSEIDQLKEEKPKHILEDVDEDDTLKSTLWEDVMHRSENWNDVQSEISGVALHVERLIFKDLVNEIVTGGAANLRRGKPAKRRQLFAN